MAQPLSLESLESFHLSWDQEENKKYLYKFLSESFGSKYSDEEIKKILRLFKKAGITDNDICNVMTEIKDNYTKLLEFAAEISCECVLCESVYCKHCECSQK